MTDLAPADAELLRLETALTAIAANLVDLDDNPARKDLDKSGLTGKTAAAWADATDALTQLWDGYRMLTDLTGQARQKRSRRKLSDTERAELKHQVLGRSITLSTTTVPLAQRGLLGTSQVHTTCSPAELLSAMEAAFQTAVDVVTRAGEVWQRLLPGAADATAAVDNVRVLIRLAGSGTATIDEADRRLGAFTKTLATDPLGVDPAELNAVRALIARADAERTSVAELRDSLTQRLADARRLATELTQAANAADQAAEAAADRFRDQDIQTVRGPDLRPDLAAIDALAAAGHWPLIGAKLADWSRRARERLTALHQTAAHNSGLLSTRNELRGRLDAYQAKALRRGFGESTELTPLAEKARTALYTAPCDLEAARAAVNAYQDALTATIAREGR
ncbi:putative tellurite resistance protein B-like protein [Actinoplanes tereljensis]|uniref:Uncharacterized protein n=1 Tax=Paractinoplanes tereljensis TaxID=571912 RepID=A0A919TU77_9ACTN|nr:hypothetical protein [Actinoplanes tereljensis]GIF22506.1 hypothetical protein Ate02nite_52360 [Actinoplanes tereljensis]